VYLCETRPSDARADSEETRPKWKWREEGHEWKASSASENLPDYLPD
jgi:hypothetical protein